MKLMLYQHINETFFLGCNACAINNSVHVKCGRVLKMFDEVLRKAYLTSISGADIV